MRVVAATVRRSRRFLALVLELLMLHVAVLGGMGCAACAAERGTQAQGVHHGQQGHHVAPAAQHDGHVRHDARAPLHQHDGAQCVAVSGCTVASMSPAITELAATVTTVHTRILVADAHLLRSARPAPEPPPPRA